MVSILNTNLHLHFTLSVIFYSISHIVSAAHPHSFLLYRPLFYYFRLDFSIQPEQHQAIVAEGSLFLLPSTALIFFEKYSFCIDKKSHSLISKADPCPLSHFIPEPCTACHIPFDQKPPRTHTQLKHSPISSYNHHA